MKIRIFRNVLCTAILMAFAAGCTADLEPHIYIPSEFDRTRSDFNKPLKDRTGVTICFNKLKTTPQKIANMAALECARFNKKAEYIRQEARFCPLLTPISAQYRCVANSSQ